jgi:single-strand DNA-binding protein
MHIATNDSYTDTNGKKIETTQWHRIVVWGKQAEHCKEYLSKGRQVYVEGRLQTRKWTDQENKTHYSTEINASNIQFLGKTEKHEKTSMPILNEGDIP